MNQIKVASLSMGTVHASTADSRSPWGGQAAVSQENDLITSVNDSAVSKRHWPRSHSLSRELLLRGPRIAALVAMHYGPMLLSSYLSVMLEHLAVAHKS